MTTNSADRLISRYVEGAARIGDYVVNQARWSGSVCTWDVTSPDLSKPGSRRALSTMAGPGLYQGAAGIAVFLSELHAKTGSLASRRTARGALDYAIRACDELGSCDFSLHNGRVGIAYALTRFASATGHDSALEEARHQLSPLFGNENRDTGLDVIGGAAGAIPILLQLASSLDLPAARISALALGDHLLAAARRRPRGWSWPSPVRSNAHDLCGFAHGAAGYAAALLELWAVTGEARFRHGAERAFDYERSHFDVEVGNWRDLRSPYWSMVLRSPTRLAERRAELRAGREVPRYETHHMVAWCHGAPGIGLTRLRAFELLKNPEFATEALVAITTTRRDLAAPQSDYSLCHGAFGNIETVLAGASLLGEPQWRREIEEWVDHALMHISDAGRRWPSGTLNGVPEPSFMLGEAGIGHALLRMAWPDIPSVLFPCAPVHHAAARPNETEILRTLVRTEEDLWFGRTKLAFERLGVHVAFDASLADTRPVLALEATIERLVNEDLATNSADSAAPRCGCLADASRVDRAYFHATCSLPNYIDELIDNLRRPERQTIDWENALLCFAPCAQIVICERDWDTWLDVTPVNEDRSAIPPRASEMAPTYVLYRRNNAMQRQRAEPFAAAILAVIQGASADGITYRKVACAIVASTGQAIKAELIEHLVREQVQLSYAAGILTIVGFGAGTETIVVDPFVDAAVPKA